jgi:hypothetical protein
VDHGVGWRGANPKLLLEVRLMTCASQSHQGLDVEKTAYHPLRVRATETSAIMRSSACPLA